MIQILLINILLLGAPNWYTAEAPPDRAGFAAQAGETPMRVLLFSARTGYSPEGYDIREVVSGLISEGQHDMRLIAWAAAMKGVPLQEAGGSILTEFGEDFMLPCAADAAADHTLIEAALRRVQHRLSGGEEPREMEGIVELVTEAWQSMPRSTMELSLELMGRMAVDITGDLTPNDLQRAGTAAFYRYFSEIGREPSAAGNPDTPLERIYAASCLPPDAAEAMLDDSLWAVRFNAAGSCGASQLQPLLSDPVPYVALQAALARREAGYADGAPVIQELALAEGPVGHMAAQELPASDSVLIKQLMEHEKPGRRAAAQSAWLSDSLPISYELEEKWLSDPFWLMPVSLAWHLMDTDDSLAAEKAVDEMVQRLDNYDEPDQVTDYAEVIRDQLRGSEETGQDTSFQWTRYSFPFELDGEIPRQMLLVTDEGPFIIELWPEIAPIACRNFVYLAETGFYDTVRFHRVIPGFVAQAGCPYGNGMGGPGYTIPNERSPRTFERGVLGMADAGLNTAGSQFFIMLDSHGRLDGRYTAFGRVQNTSGLDEITVGTGIQKLDPLSQQGLAD